MRYEVGGWVCKVGKWMGKYLRIGGVCVCWSENLLRYMYSTLAKIVRYLTLKISLNKGKVKGRKGKVSK